MHEKMKLIFSFIILMVVGNHFVLSMNLSFESNSYPNWNSMKNEPIGNGNNCNTLGNIIKYQKQDYYNKNYRTAIIQRSCKYLFIITYFGGFLIYKLRANEVIKKVIQIIQKIDSFFNNFDIEIPMLKWINTTAKSLANNKMQFYTGLNTIANCAINQLYPDNIDGQNKTFSELSSKYLTSDLSVLSPEVKNNIMSFQVVNLKIEDAMDEFNKMIFNAKLEFTIPENA
ncbi:uncharacterized protein LOC126896799 [Daktulosphaira vitifoliae]|uniref:uncharacterized protein LOC126896799 n=1 Tax=Daktulosphaira vitifoliae TaxID=58002 RepID=UPI0021AA9B21|nr:uncharacterized protein LOC126896799 [Daktulosphaira vitifoliae]